MVLKVPVARFAWHPAYRIVPTRHPSVYLFDRVADPADFDALYALEAMTNDRVREETGRIEIVPKEDRVLGPGSGPIMAAFTHVNPQGSRFSDGSFGVFYAASKRETAIAETKHHHGRFLRATAEGPMHLPMRLYRVEIDAQLHDLRRHKDAAVFDPDSYSASQALGVRLMKAGSNGVGFRSVRDPGGECVGLFKPRGAASCLHHAHLLYAWDGARFTDVYEKTDVG
jgi:hypothetical protein